MARNTRYKNKPCGYCGTITGENEGEHVIPSCLYPSITDPRVQRLKISACPQCNDSWQNDEPHFRNVVACCGENPNQERYEILQTSISTIRNVRGIREFRDLDARLVPLDEDATRHKVFPAADPRAMRVLRKIVRGLCHFRNNQEIVADERVWTDVMRYRIPPEFDHELRVVYEVPRVFVGRAAYFDGLESELDFQSAWFLKFFDSVEFVAVVRPANSPKQHCP